VYRLMKSGAIASVRIRGSRRIPASALRRYIEPSAGARS
jgi:excisionase family DNA binding protein